MPLKLNVGVSRKIGLPEYSSAGASCNIEVELAGDLLQNSPNAFHAQVRSAFAAAQQAVNDELAELQTQLAPPPRAALPAPRNGYGHTDGPAAPRNGMPAQTNGAAYHNGSSRDRPAKRCTPNQIRAIRAIVRNLGLDLKNVLHEQYGVEQPDELSLSQASELIDELKASSES